MNNNRTLIIQLWLFGKQWIKIPVSTPNAFKIRRRFGEYYQRCSWSVCPERVRYNNPVYRARLHYERELLG